MCSQGGLTTAPLNPLLCLLSIYLLRPRGASSKEPFPFSQSFLASRSISSKVISVGNTFTVARQDLRD